MPNEPLRQGHLVNDAGSRFGNFFNIDAALAAANDDGRLRGSIKHYCQVRFPFQVDAFAYHHLCVGKFSLCKVRTLYLLH